MMIKHISDNFRGVLRPPGRFPLKNQAKSIKPPSNPGLDPIPGLYRLPKAKYRKSTKSLKSQTLRHSLVPPLEDFSLHVWVDPGVFLRMMGPFFRYLSIFAVGPFESGDMEGNPL